MEGWDVWRAAMALCLISCEKEETKPPAPAVSARRRRSLDAARH